MVIPAITPGQSESTTSAKSSAAAPADAPNPQLEQFRGLLDAVRTDPPKPRSYTVRRGESLWEICKQKLREDGKAPTTSEIQRAVNEVAQKNGLRNPDLIRIGQELDLSTLTPAKAPAVAVTPETSTISEKLARIPDRPLNTVVAPLGIGPVSRKALPVAPPLQPRELPVRTPLRLERPTHQRLATLTPRVNPFLKERAIRPVESNVTLAANRETQDLTALMQSILDEKVAGAAKPEEEAGPWRRLLKGAARLSSAFGMRKDPFTGRPQHHNGIDIAAVQGTHVHPYKAGTVTFSGWRGGYGRVVVVKHDDGIETIYGHTSKNLVKAGDDVTPKTAIAHVGSTGRSTGPHLHFEVRRDGHPIDPVQFLDDSGLQVAQVL